MNPEGNKTEENVENLEAQKPTPEKWESFEELKTSFGNEVENDISEFKQEDVKIRQIEESVNLTDQQEVENIKNDLKIEETLRDFNEKADELKEDIKIELEPSKEETINPELIQGIQGVLDAEDRMRIAQEEIVELNKNIHEIMPEEYKIKIKCAEVYILKAKGDITIHGKGISEETLNKFREKNKTIEGKIASESPQERESRTKKEQLMQTFQILEEKARSYGYDLDSAIKLEHSEKQEEREIFNEIEKLGTTLSLTGEFEDLSRHSPNTLLDSIPEIKSENLRMVIFKDCVDREEISTQKLVNMAFSKLINRENIAQVLPELEYRISKDKQEALKDLPVEEALSSWENDPPSNRGWSTEGDRRDMFSQKFAGRIDQLVREGDLQGIIDIKNRLHNLDSNEMVPKFYESYPRWLKDLNINYVDAESILTKNLPEKAFRGYFDTNYKFIPYTLIPDSLSREEKEEYNSRILLKDDITGSDVEEYCKHAQKDIFEVIHENQRARIAVLKSQDVRKKVISRLISENAIDSQDTHTAEALASVRTKNILESFLVEDNKQELPPLIRETLERFENNYGNKGKDLVALAVSAYGTKNPEGFARRMKSIESTLNKYNPDTLPEGAKVSMGIEYEVTDSIANIYEETSILGYKTDIELVSGSAHIGKGTDAIHEIALKPNYNPYMLMAEMKLLQDGGFFDLNFERYAEASRGYHLSLVGDSGLAVDQNMYFLNNMLTMSQLTGVTAGKEINKTKGIHSKSFEHFTYGSQKGDRCEIKGMATDSVEQFEKAIITAHHAGIAIQLCNKYIPEMIPLVRIPDTSEEFGQMLSYTGSLAKSFESDQERDIVYEWVKLKKSTVNAVEQHNQSFVDSEFNGFVIDKEGNYIDTSEHIDVMRNKKLLNEGTLLSEEFKNRIYINAEDLSFSQEPQFVNALTNINNIFLKPPQGGDNSPVNAKSALDTVKKEGYSGILDGKRQESIFENGGEFRDGYYYIQGASEEMIIHKSQILLNHFNKNMETLLKTKGVKREVERKEAVAV